MLRETLAAVESHHLSHKTEDIVLKQQDKSENVDDLVRVLQEASLENQ